MISTNMMNSGASEVFTVLEQWITNEKNWKEK
jgi:hypothetical protein